MLGTHGTHVWRNRPSPSPRCAATQAPTPSPVLTAGADAGEDVVVVEVEVLVRVVHILNRDSVVHGVQVAQALDRLAGNLRRGMTSVSSMQSLTAFRSSLPALECCSSSRAQAANWQQTGSKPEVR